MFINAYLSAIADTPPTPAPFTQHPGPTVSSTVQSPEDCFSLFFDDALVDFLVEQTNRYAQKISGMQLTDRSLYKNWRPVTREEMLGFIAVILNMGIIQMNNLKDYWSTDETTNLPFFRSVFSRDRLFQIFGSLHAGDPDDTTKKGKIQPLLDRLSGSFEAAFLPSKQIAVDESVISFKGRVSFKQYLKGKPNPWGIKAFVLADSSTGYMHRLCIYYGKDTELIDRPDLGQTVRVVLTLVEPFHNKGYDLYIDRLYSSPILANELTQVGITVTGTVQLNRKGLPQEAKVDRKDPRDTVHAYRSNDGLGDLLLLTWTDKRKIAMLSTKHTVSMVQVVSRYVINAVVYIMPGAHEPVIIYLHHTHSPTSTHTHTHTHKYTHTHTHTSTHTHTHKHTHTHTSTHTKYTYTHTYTHYILQ